MRPVPPAELEALLRLRCVPGLGDARLRALLAEHGSAEGLLRVPPQALGGHGQERDSVRTAGRVARALRVIEELRVTVLRSGRTGYPVALEQLHRPPLLLFARGRLELLAELGVAVVGTRRPADYGAGVAAQLAAGIARAGLVVWSGLARGIDAIAHRAALEAGGSTVAVLGSGIDVVYPREHERLAEQMAVDGLLVTEYLPGEPPLPHHFPERNRIIACLAAATLVIEAREDGGALITAEQATDLGRHVMAVPGPIGRVTSHGPNRLIQDGAKLVMEVADVLEELGGELNAAAARPRPSSRRRWSARPPEAPGGLGPAAEVSAQATPPRPTVAARYLTLWRAFGGETRHVDELAARCRESVSAVLGLLLELELDGRVRHLGAQRYRRVA